MKKNKFIRWVFLCTCILLAAHPAWTQSPPKSPEDNWGAAPFEVRQEKHQLQVVSFDDLYFNYMPPVDVEHPDGNITKGTKKPMPIP